MWCCPPGILGDVFESKGAWCVVLWLAKEEEIV